MEDPSPSTTDCGGYEITHKDFLPASDGHAKPSYESFKTLMNHANKWLKLNTQWKVKTCETMEFNFNDNMIETSKMVYCKGRSIHNIRALRMWLQRFPPGEEKVQEIGYVNLIPKITYPSSFPGTYAEFEKLGDIVKRYNEKKDSSPIPGHIITIETQAYKVKGDNVVDPEFTSWTERGTGHYQFVFVIRIYFEIGEPMMEKIGFQDFIPDATTDSCIPMCKKYQDFSDMEYKASRWCLRQTNLTICNNQFLMTKLVGGCTTADSTKMSFVRHGFVYAYNPAMQIAVPNRRPTAFLRILRVAYIRLNSGVKVPFPRFTCKSFIPVFLKEGVCMNGTHPEFETLQQTVQRASDWIKKTGANVLSIETSDGRLYKEGAVYSSGVSFYYTPSRHDKYYYFVIRVYVDGNFGEESEESDQLIPSHKCCCSIQ